MDVAWPLANEVVPFALADGGMRTVNGIGGEMLCLIARYDTETIRFDMPVRSARIGSAEDNDIVLPFSGVSRHHALAEPAGKGLLLRDKSSKNGLWVEGRRSSEVFLGGASLVILGGVTLSIENVADSDVELAFELDRRPGLRHVRNAKRETDAGSGSLEGGAAHEVIRFVRDLALRDPACPYPGLLGKVCAVFGCRTALLLSPSRPGGVVVEGREGETLPDPELASLLTSASDGRRGEDDGAIEVQTHGTSVIALARSRKGRGAIGIVFSGAEAVVDSWQRELLRYLADCVLDEGSGAPEEARRLASFGTLSLPKGMVIGGSTASGRLLREVEATACSGLDVLLLGETGTGKEYFARLIHASGPTPHGPFVAVNCAAIPAELLEAELFGVHGRVATGVDPRPGQIALAQGGTVFLDEVGELAESLQAKLLRFLQEREILPLGAPVPCRVSLRVVSASNRDLGKAAREGTFRSDLYYRLRGLQYVIPPLRERTDDIAALAVAFADRAAAEFGRDARGVSRTALDLLAEHDWPGNVRELEAEVKRAVLLCPPGEALQMEQFGSVAFAIAERRKNASREAAPVRPPDRAPEIGPRPTSMRLDERLESVEREAIEDALSTAKGNKSLAARLLGITRNGLAMKITRLTGSRH